jgi:hypothetical protein
MSHRSHRSHRYSYLRTRMRIKRIYRLAESAESAEILINEHELDEFIGSQIRMSSEGRAMTLMSYAESRLRKTVVKAQKAQKFLLTNTNWTNL